MRVKSPDKVRERERLASVRRRGDYRIPVWRALNRAVISGKLVKPTDCEACGEVKKLTGHHEDYSKPLDVRWLCYECHGIVHRKIKTQLA